MLKAFWKKCAGCARLKLRRKRAVGKPRPMRNAVGANSGSIPHKLSALRGLQGHEQSCPFCFKLLEALRCSNAPLNSVAEAGTYRSGRHDIGSDGWRYSALLLNLYSHSHATRKPRSLHEKFGAFAARAVVRRFWNRDFQLPPRCTRFDPEVGPFGSTRGTPRYAS